MSNDTGSGVERRAELIEVAAQAYDAAGEGYDLFDYTAYPGDEPPHVVRDKSGQEVYRSHDAVAALREFERLSREHAFGAVVDAVKVKQNDTNLRVARDVMANDDIRVDPILVAMARSDAAFDGRDFNGFGRADKRRYLERCAWSRMAGEAAGMTISPKPAQFPLESAEGGVIHLPADLAARCREIAEWRKSGRLEGDKLRSYAQRTQSGFGPPDVRLAETLTMNEVLDLLLGR